MHSNTMRWLIVLVLAFIAFVITRVAALYFDGVCQAGLCIVSVPPSSLNKQLESDNVHKVGNIVFADISSLGPRSFLLHPPNERPVADITCVSSTMRYKSLLPLSRCRCDRVLVVIMCYHFTMIDVLHSCVLSTYPAGLKPGFNSIRISIHSQRPLWCHLATLHYSCERHPHLCFM